MLHKHTYANIRPVLLCGGMGARLAPLSTPEKPKPFLPLLSECSMLQETLLRVRGMRAPAILCNSAHVGMVRNDLRQLHVEPDVILPEPSSKNTAPAAALAARYYEEKEDVLLFLPCDHQIKDLSAFHQAIVRAYDAAMAGNVVLFGETPSVSETGYGYIKTRNNAAGSDHVYDICLFHEKPGREQAVTYIKSGCFWNTGIVMVRTSTLADAFKRHCPQLWALISRLDPCAPCAEVFNQLPRISLDYALLEKVADKKVCPVSMGWSDIGTFDRLKASA